MVVILLVFLAEVLGILATIIGAYMINPWLALMIAGIMLIIWSNMRGGPT